MGGRVREGGGVEEDSLCHQVVRGVNCDLSNLPTAFRCFSTIDNGKKIWFTQPLCVFVRFCVPEGAGPGCLQLRAAAGCRCRAAAASAAMSRRAAAPGLHTGGGG